VVLVASVVVVLASTVVVVDRAAVIGGTTEGGVVTLIDGDVVVTGEAFELLLHAATVSSDRVATIVTSATRPVIELSVRW
jgi:hypothetical protein